MNKDIEKRTHRHSSIYHDVRAQFEWTKLHVKAFLFRLMQKQICGWRTNDVFGFQRFAIPSFL
jgi:predicted transcriptional regulator